MCRWVGYQGAPVFLETVLSTTGHSLVHQSQSATESKTVTNGDGFGVAWYDHHAEPGLFRDILPAWSNPNLKSLGRQVRGHTILAHVRAATGGGVNHENCHPFVCGRWSFMHNGQIGGFAAIRRDLDMALPPALYPHRHGTTDSEALFLLAMAAGLPERPKAALESAVGFAENLSRGQGATPHMRLSVCCTDGRNVYAARYASDKFAPTLYYCIGAAGVTIASEPIDDCPDWQSVPAGSFLSLIDGVISLEEFVPDLSYRAANLHAAE